MNTRSKRSAGAPPAAAATKSAAEPAASATVRAVDRALDILAAFRPHDSSLSASELLERVDLSRPTLYRMLATLQQRGFVVGEGEPLRVRLGPAVGQLAQAWRAGLDLPARAQPVMQRLWERSRETVALFTPEGHDRVCVAELESPQPLRFRRGVGYRERLVRGASGRAILAHMPLTSEALSRLYARTGLDAREQADELAAIRRRGHAISRNELIEGAVAIAAPFFDASGRVGGSLALFGPAVRMKEARVRELSAEVVRAAGELSQALGHGG